METTPDKSPDLSGLAIEGSGQEKQRHSRLALASVLGAGGQAITLIFGLWASPKFVHGLGDASYSVLAIISAFFSYFMFLELGFGPPYVRELAAAFARNDAPRTQVFFETGQAIYISVAILGTIIMFVAGFPYLSFTIQQPDLLSEARRCLIVLAIMFSLPMALSSFRGVVIATQHSEICALILIVAQPAILVVQVTAIHFGGRLFSVLLVQAAGTILCDIILVISAYRLASHLRFRPHFHREVWREVRSFSLYKFVNQLALQGYFTADRFLLAAIVPLSQIAPYALAASVAQRIRIIVNASLTPFFALASENFAKHGTPGLAGVCDSYIRRIASLLALFAAGAAFLSFPFLTAWVGPRYAETGAPVLCILSIAAFFSILSVVAGQGTDAAGVPRAGTIGAVLGLVISLCAGVPLALAMGVSGAAWGFLAGAVCHFVWNGFALGRVLGRKDMSVLVSNGLIRPAAMGIIALLGMLLTPHSQSLWMSLPAALAGTVLGTIAGFALGILRRQDLQLGWIGWKNR